MNPPYTRSRTRVSDHSTFFLGAAAISAVVMVGFARSYYLRTLFAQEDALSGLVQLHGALMTAWLAVFVMQIVLVAIGRTDLHRRVGRAGTVLLFLILATAVPLSIAAARLGGTHMPGPAVPALAFIFGFLLAFGALAGAGLCLTRRPDTHKRLMLVATLAAMEAGTSRLPFAFLANPLMIHLASDALLVGIIAIDTFRQRRLHPAFVWGALFLVAMQVLIAWVAGTGVWARVAQQIIGI